MPTEYEPHHLDPAMHYRQTLAKVQQRLHPASKAFSRVIHHPAVEAASDAAGATVARPSVLNGALWTAVVVGGVFYATAKVIGYRLSGSEMLFAMAAGALLGLLGETVVRAFKRSA